MKSLKNQLNGNAKTRFTLALCTVLLVSGGSVRAQDEKNAGAAAKDAATTASASSLSQSDQKLIQDAARCGMMEVHMGKIGVQKAQSESVKQFAQKLIDDHTKANTELRQLAASKGVTLPEPREGITSTDPSVTGIDAAGAPGANTGVTTDRSQVRDKSGHDDSDKAQSEMKKLHSLSGTDFDKAFVKAAVKGHEKNVKEFEKASEKANDAEVKAFAAKTLPTLREHLQAVKALESQVKDAGAASPEAGSESGISPSKSTTPESK